jgi:hypothetical protein
MSILRSRLKIQRYGTLPFQKGQLDVIRQQEVLIWISHRAGLFVAIAEDWPSRNKVLDTMSPGCGCTFHLPMFL